jgi:hypothetical protein
MRGDNIEMDGMRRVKNIQYQITQHIIPHRLHSASQGTKEKRTYKRKLSTTVARIP